MFRPAAPVWLASARTTADCTSRDTRNCPPARRVGPAVAAWAAVNPDPQTARWGSRKRRINTTVHGRRRTPAGCRWIRISRFSSIRPLAITAPIRRPEASDSRAAKAIRLRASSDRSVMTVVSKKPVVRPRNLSRPGQPGLCASATALGTVALPRHFAIQATEFGNNESIVPCLSYCFKSKCPGMGSGLNAARARQMVSRCKKRPRTREFVQIT
jgi:hypothetical protein